MTERQIQFETVSYRTVKGKETKLAGTIAELLVQRKIQEEGFSVKNCSETAYCKYDLLVNNQYRVEVKFSKGRDLVSGKSWSFMSPSYDGYDIVALVKGGTEEVVYLTREDRKKITAKTVIYVSNKQMRSDLKETFIEAVKGIRTPAKSDRNKEIYRLKRDGKTFKELSYIFTISEKRVKDIYYKQLKGKGIAPRKYDRL